MNAPARSIIGHDRLVTPELVLMAHRLGVRPATRKAGALRWIEPPSPAVLPVERLTPAPRVLHAWRQGGFELTVGRATAAVIDELDGACRMARRRSGRSPPSTCPTGPGP